MEIWINNGYSDTLRLPVNPESLGYNGSNNFEDTVLANGDEKVVISGRNLRTYSIKSFIPKDWTYYSNAYPETPMGFVQRMKWWMEQKRVLQLIVTGTDINETVTIRSFDWEMVGLGEIDYTIELKQHVPVSNNVLAMVTNRVTSTSNRPASQEQPPKTYTVVSGDCLWNIAKKFYGQGSQWPKIYDRNKSVVGSNPNRIYPGQKLVIP